MSDKTTMTGVTTIAHNTKVDVRSGTIINETVDHLYINLVMPEINRMLSLKDQNIEGYNKGANKFYFLPELNNIEGLFLSSGEINPNFTEYENQIKNLIVTHVNQLVSKKLVLNKSVAVS